MKSAPRVLALMGACALAAAALQGTATASSIDANLQMSSTISARISTTGMAPAADANGLAGYFGPVGGTQKVVGSMTVNKTSQCASGDKGVYQEFITGTETAASGVVIFSVCVDGAPIYAYNNCSSDVNEPCAGVPEGKLLKANDKLLITITDGATNKVKVQNVTQSWTQTEDGPAINPALLNIDDQRVLIGDPGVLVPMPNFGATKLTGVTVSGQTLASTSPTKYNMVNDDNERLVTTSNIAANGKDFTMKIVQAE